MLKTGKTAKKRALRKMRIHRLVGFLCKTPPWNVLWITKEERRIERFYLVRKYTIKPVNKVEIEEQK
jgi:hypothetical protein